MQEPVSVTEVGENAYWKCETASSTNRTSGGTSEVAQLNTSAWGGGSGHVLWQAFCKVAFQA